MLRIFGRQVPLNKNLACIRGFSSAIPLLQQKQGNETKMARVLAMEVNKMKAQYRTSPSAELQHQYLQELAATPLTLVQQVEAKTIVHLLGALEELRAPPDHPLIKGCADWVTNNANNIGSMLLLAQSLLSVAHLNKEIGLDLIASVQSRILATPDDIDAPVASKLLSASRAAGLTYSGGSLNVSAPIIRREANSPYGFVTAEALATAIPTADLNTPLSWQEKCVAVLRKNIPTAHPADLLVMAHALQSSPNDVVLFTEIIELASASLPQLQTEELVRLVPLIARSYMSKELRDKRLLETLKLIEPSVALLLPADAAVIYDGLRGFDTLTDPVAERLTEVASKIPLASASMEEALGLAIRLKEHSPPVITDSILTNVSSYFSNISSKPSSVVKLLFAALAVCPALQHAGLPMKLGDQIMKELKDIQGQASKTTGQSAISADLLGALMTAPMTQMYGTDLHSLVIANFDKWKYADTIKFIGSASFVRNAEARKILRDIAQKVAQSVHTSTGEQLVVLACAYGRSGVRNDILCNAVSEKCVTDRKTLGPHGLSTCLAFLAAVDYRNNKCFVELQADVRAWVNSCGPTQIMNLIASYAKMLLWNLKIFYPLVARAADLAEFFSPLQLIGLLVSIERVDVRHPPLSLAILRRCQQVASHVDPKAAIGLLVALSKYGLFDSNLYEALGKVAAIDPSALSASDIGDLLMSFVRAGYTDNKIFHDLIMPVLAVAPTASSLAIGNVATAYSSIGLKHEELFEILAERTLVLKEECPAVIIAAILAAFARVGIRNDKLFIELISRVRHVPTYGAPQDLVNVVTAYSMAGVWHMRLFTKIADRAIYTRGEFRGSQIAELLAAFARVEMKYDKLFTEFSPRIQACALTLGTADLISIAQSYASAIPDPAVFGVIGDRLAQQVGTLSEQEKRSIMNAYSKAGISHNGLANALSGLPPSAAATESQSA